MEEIIYDTIVTGVGVVIICAALSLQFWGRRNRRSFISRKDKLTVMRDVFGKEVFLKHIDSVKTLFNVRSALQEELPPSDFDRVDTAIKERYFNILLWTKIESIQCFERQRIEAAYPDMKNWLFDLALALNQRPTPGQNEQDDQLFYQRFQELCFPSEEDAQRWYRLDEQERELQKFTYDFPKNCNCQFGHVLSYITPADKRKAMEDCAEEGLKIWRENEGYYGSEETDVIDEHWDYYVLLKRTRILWKVPFKSYFEVNALTVGKIMHLRYPRNLCA
jgi:hypothetical protein